MLHSKLTSDGNRNMQRCYINRSVSSLSICIISKKPDQVCLLQWCMMDLTLQITTIIMFH